MNVYILDLYKGDEKEIYQFINICSSSVSLFLEVYTSMKGQP